MLTAADVQQIFMQSSTVQKVQQTQQQHPDTEQKYLALQLSEARKLLQEKVTNAEEAKRVLLRDKEERRQRKKAVPDRPPPGKMPPANMLRHPPRKSRVNISTFGYEWMNPPSLFYVQIGIDVLMCLLILYFLWRIGVKRELPDAGGEEARRELERLISESQQSARQFLDALGEGRRSLKELASALDEKETRLQALCNRVEALLADAVPRCIPGDPATGCIDREQVLRMNKDGASVSDIMRKTGLTEGEVHLIIDLARSQNEKR